MRLIDADALKQFEINFLMSDGYGYADVVYAGYIHNAPTIDAVPVKHAKLVNPNPFGECSICGYLIDIRQEYNYCPNCGAKMDGGKDDADNR